LNLLDNAIRYIRPREEAYSSLLPSGTIAPVLPLRTPASEFLKSIYRIFSSVFIDNRVNKTNEEALGFSYL